VFWNPADAPAVVHLVAPISPIGPPSIPLLQSAIDARVDEAGLHWCRLSNGAVIVQAVETPVDTPMGVIIPLDDDWSIRLAAAERLRNMLEGKTTDPPLTAQRRGRVKRALRCIDARTDGASYRAVATAFFGARRVTEEPWKTSSLKAQIARLAAHGRMLVDQGYRMLLRGRLD